MGISTTTGVATAGLYAATVWQRYQNTDVRWVNRYQVMLYESINYGTLGVFAQALADFHADVLAEGLQVEKVTISTREEDSNPYDGDELASFRFNLAGRAYIPKLLPLTAVTMVNKVTFTGRWGKVYLRGTVGEDDVDVVLGKWILHPVSNLPTRIETAANARLAPFMDDNPDGVKLILLSRNTVRNVIGMSFARVGVMKLDRKYYDKGTSTQGTSS